MSLPFYDRSGQRQLMELEILQSLPSLQDIRLVREVGLERNLILKAPRPGADLLQIQALIQEGELLSRLSHPNILPLLAAGSLSDGRPALLFPEVHGNTLEAQITIHAGKEEHLPRLIRIFLKLTEALAHAHERGIVHRDVKPQNLLVDEGGEAWLVDWGLAGAPGPLTGKLLGTPCYMAPEQLRAEYFDLRTEVYNLGATLFHLLTGEQLYKNMDLESLLQTP